MQTIYLDISNNGVIPTIHAKQGDVGRKFQVVLTDSGLPYIPVGGSAFSVWYSGASGEGNYTEVGDKSAFSVSGNKVTVEMISQMLSNDGEGILSLVLNNPNGNQISTWNIHYVCEYVPGAGSQEAKAYYTAFSQAVENLPYPDASLSASGKAADAAATGMALAGKAPAGYGLGEEAAKSLDSTHDLNNIYKAGWYRWSSSVPANAPSFGNSKTYGNMRVDMRSDTSFVQTVYNQVGTWNNVFVRRHCQEGVFGEWEWENPPMALGVEYRTTERWNGNAVYTRLIDIGHLANKDYVYANLNIATKNIISLDVICHGGTVAFQQNGVAGDGDIMYRTYIENGYLYIQTFTDMSSYTGLCKVKYVK